MNVIELWFKMEIAKDIAIGVLALVLFVILGIIKLGDVLRRSRGKK